MTLARDEIFGPVLAVERMEDLDGAIAAINASEFGNAAAIFTRDGGAARKFVREAQAGMIGVNVRPGPRRLFPVRRLARLVLRRPPRHRARRGRVLHREEGGYDRWT